MNPARHLHLPGSENPLASEWSIRSTSPISKSLEGASQKKYPHTPNHGHISSSELEIENASLRGDLEWRIKDQMRVEGDLLAVMAEWREKVAALEDRLADMGHRHQLDREELVGKMRGMYTSEVVSKLQKDLATALDLRESAMADDLGARDIVIKELGVHLRSAHESNQRMHLELQDLQSKYHEELATSRGRDVRHKEQVEEVKEALRSSRQNSVASAEAQHLQNLNQELLRELALAKRTLLGSTTDKNRIQRESEWAVSTMTTELQRAQHALVAFEDELREGRLSRDQTRVQQTNDAKLRRASADLDAEKDRVVSLEQQMDMMQQELKRKCEEIKQLQVSLSSVQGASPLSIDDTLLASSPNRRQRANAGSQASSPLHSEFLQQQQQKQQKQQQAMMSSEVSALRTAAATTDRECIELNSTLDAQKSKERIMVESLQSKDAKIVMLEVDVQRLHQQLNTAQERQLRSAQELKEGKLQMEEDRMRMMHSIRDLERDREAAMVNCDETAYQAETRSKNLDMKEGELSALQSEYDRAVSDWKAAKLDYNTKIAEATARAATSQEAILLLEADLEMKNKLLDQVVESSGEGNDTLSIYVASLHHAGLIAKSLDARNKELRKKMGESEQFRLAGLPNYFPNYLALGRTLASDLGARRRRTCPTSPCIRSWTGRTAAEGFSPTSPRAHWIGPEGARGKRRGFSPGAAVRHSKYARVYTEFFPKNLFLAPNPCFFFIFPSSAYTHTYLTC